ncbi:MAG: hypothetical protein A3J83_07390 [Elusimicrobia bacterium RIFOXYA2_FULL_40_6]|nr:MAG: hypothetical protein A3J83_07390 [Elusimicrobia bacterium RIFOXYA2_FULL_40_6]
MNKITAILILFAISLAAVCVCSDNCFSENDGHHCIVCCNSEDHSVISGGVITTSLLKVTYAVFVQNNFNDQIFDSDIEHPPKVSA